MVVSTKNTNTGTPNGTPLVLDDETWRFLVETLTGFIEGTLANVQRQMADMANDITALSLQNNQVVNRGPQLNHSRMAKIEFPKEYEDAFDSLLSRVEISEEHAISMFMGGLPTKIEMEVRMFKPKTLADAYCLTNLQEATLNAVKKKGRSAFVPNQLRYSNGSNSTYQKPLLTTPTSSTNNTTVKPNTPYVPGHKCSGQLYSIVFVPEMESEGDFLELDESIVNNGLIDLQEPLISLNALTSTNNFKTTRVIGTIGKHLLHILIDYESTHYFLDRNMAKQLGCNIRTTYPLSVIVADGNKLVTTSECKRFKWQFGPHPFSTDVMLLPLGGCDMILGIQCTKALSKSVKQATIHSMALCIFPYSASTCMQVEEVPSAPISPIL
ncbi:reverse transcriptase [Tanacetum coccineum]|uniref:Reverse transcriptase n=1 Tax=Tanacetum coccineum TaxID=301880 RepID=A0ABQ5A075_9ASTR